MSLRFLVRSLIAYVSFDLKASLPHELLRALKYAARLHTCINNSALLSAEERHEHDLIQVTQTCRDLSALPPPRRRNSNIWAGDGSISTVHLTPLCGRTCSRRPHLTDSAHVRALAGSRRGVGVNCDENCVACSTSSTRSEETGPSC